MASPLGIFDIEPLRVARASTSGAAHVSQCLNPHATSCLSSVVKFTGGRRGILLHHMDDLPYYIDAVQRRAPRPRR